MKRREQLSYYDCYFLLKTRNSCRISKSTTLPQVTSNIITFSKMVRFSCVLPLWKAIELTITPVLTVLKNIENWPFYSQSRKTWHFFWTPFRDMKCEMYYLSHAVQLPVLNGCKRIPTFEGSSNISFNISYLGYYFNLW